MKPGMFVCPLLIDVFVTVYIQGFELITVQLDYHQRSHDKQEVFCACR